MAAVSNATSPSSRSSRSWKTPGSKYNWFFLAVSLLLVSGVFVFYYHGLITEPYPGPDYDPFREFGIVAFVMILLVTAYTLRRRFVRRLPGKVQSWLWLHIWFGITCLLIVCMHENFQNVTREFSFVSQRFTEAAYGTSALYALGLLVISGVIGRLLDLWQAHVISGEASTNQVGIAQAVEERLEELSLTLERLCAGKSPQFKRASEEALLQPVQQLPSDLSPTDVRDFQQVAVVSQDYRRLQRSYRRQVGARAIMRVWRAIHIPLACLSLAIIAYHSLFELWSMFNL